MAAGEISLNVKLDQSAGHAGWFRLMLAKHIMDSMTLLVGIPEKNAGGGEGRGLNNVQLAFLHSHGSAVNNIPPRPFIEPAIELEENKEKIARQFKAAFMAALQLDRGGAEAALNKAGMQAEKAVKTYIGSDALAPNAPITLHGGWMRNKVSGKAVFVKGKGEPSRPLVDTGALKKAVIYVIEGGGK